MDALTLREAAERTSRSVTTLRRYIRGGRLQAVKRPGRFGPEFFVSTQGLSEAGLTVDADVAPRAPEPHHGRSRTGGRAPAEVSSADIVPLSLFQELLMKHEQLLVQYGMVRASGLAVFELRAELETHQRQLAEAREQIGRIKHEMAVETARLRGELQRAELEQEGASLENAALREKVRGLEMLTRNARTSETIEHQYREVMQQARRVERLAAGLPEEQDLRSVPAHPEVDH